MKPFRDVTRFIALLLLSLSSLAQQTAPPARPSIPPTGFPGLDQYRASRIAIFTDDFGELARYRDANVALKRSDSARMSSTCNPKSS